MQTDARQIIEAKRDPNGTWLDTGYLNALLTGQTLELEKDVIVTGGPEYQQTHPAPWLLGGKPPAGMTNTSKSYLRSCLEVIDGHWNFDGRDLLCGHEAIIDAYLVFWKSQSVHRWEAFEYEIDMDFSAVQVLHPDGRLISDYKTLANQDQLIAYLGYDQQNHIQAIILDATTLDQDPKREIIVDGLAPYRQNSDAAATSVNEARLARVAKRVTQEINDGEIQTLLSRLDLSALVAFGFPLAIDAADTISLNVRARLAT